MRMNLNKICMLNVDTLNCIYFRSLKASFKLFRPMTCVIVSPSDMGKCDYQSQANIGLWSLDLDKLSQALKPLRGSDKHPQLE